MKKSELERLLIEPGGRETVAARSEYLKQKYGMTGATAGEPAERAALFPAAPQSRSQTAREIAMNDEDFVVRTGALVDLARYVEDFRDTQAAPLAKALIGKFREAKPSFGELALLENVINSLVSQGELDKPSQALVDQAIEVLAKADAPRSRGGDQ